MIADQRQSHNGTHMLLKLRNIAGILSKMA